MGSNNVYEAPPKPPGQQKLTPVESIMLVWSDFLVTTIPFEEDPLTQTQLYDQVQLLQEFDKIHGTKELKVYHNHVTYLLVQF